MWGTQVHLPAYTSTRQEAGNFPVSITGIWSPLLASVGTSLAWLKPLRDRYRSHNQWKNREVSDWGREKEINVEREGEARDKQHLGVL